MDDVYKLNSNLSYEVVDAGTQCDPTTNSTGDWSLPNSTTIVVNDETSTIRKFDGKNLELVVGDNSSSLISYYVKQ